MLIMYVIISKYFNEQYQHITILISSLINLIFQFFGFLFVVCLKLVGVKCALDFILNNFFIGYLA